MLRLNKIRQSRVKKLIRNKKHALPFRLLNKLFYSSWANTDGLSLDWPARLYWRSDTRNPKLIFNTGFTVRNEKKNKESNKKLKWWRNSIVESTGLFADDADVRSSVSMSFNMASACLFPAGKELFPIPLPPEYYHGYDLALMTSLPENDKNKAETGVIYLSNDGKYIVRNYQGIQEGNFDTMLIKNGSLVNLLREKQFVNAILEVTSKAGHASYYENSNKEIIYDMGSFTFLYAIALPAPFQIGLDKELLNSQQIPHDYKDIVIDLHSYQVMQAQKKLLETPKLWDNQNDILLTGWPLYAYEAMAYGVPRENIMFAVKVARTPEFYVDIEGSEFSTFELNRCFKVHTDILLNEHFKSTQSLNIMNSENKNSSVIQFNYQHEKDMALQTIKDAASKDHIRTPLMSDGLAGKAFRCPSEESSITTISFLKQLALMEQGVEETCPLDTTTKERMSL